MTTAVFLVLPGNDGQRAITKGMTAPPCAAAAAATSSSCCCVKRYFQAPPPSLSATLASRIMVLRKSILLTSLPRSSYTSYHLSTQLTRIGLYIYFLVSSMKMYQVYHIFRTSTLMVFQPQALQLISRGVEHRISHRRHHAI